MMRRALLLAALMLIALPVMADAPIGHYDEFVRDTPMIRDTKTLLEWERGLDNGTRVLKGYAAAETGCTTLSMRLPTVKELLTLVDEQPHKEYEFGKTVEKAIDQLAFGKYTSIDEAYWSSTPTDNPDEVWGVLFSDGSMKKLKKQNANAVQAYARCVK